MFISRRGEIGIHAALKMLWAKARVSSTLTVGTSKDTRYLRSDLSITVSLKLILTTYFRCAGRTSIFNEPYFKWKTIHLKS